MYFITDAGDCFSCDSSRFPREEGGTLNSKIIEILQAGREALQAELKQIDLGIESLTSAHGRDSKAVNMLVDGRGRTQAQIDVLEKTINRVRQIEEGKAKEPATEKAITPGQYSGLKLSTAAQAYLGDRGRGPISCSRVVQDLTLAGVVVKQTRSKHHKDLQRNLNTRDIRLLAANNTKRFSYDSTTDSISMTTALGPDTGWKRKRGRGPEFATS